MGLHDEKCPACLRLKARCKGREACRKAASKTAGLSEKAACVAAMERAYLAAPTIPERVDKIRRSVETNSPNDGYQWNIVERMFEPLETRIADLQQSLKEAREAAKALTVDSESMTTEAGRTS